MSVYKIIEEIENGRKVKIDKQASQASQASQDALSLCNDSNNFGTDVGQAASQGRPNDQKPTVPKQDPCPIAVPDAGRPEDAELISRDLRYLNGISEDLTGWTLWKRIEQGREHRFALDAAGAVRWGVVRTLNRT